MGLFLFNKVGEVELGGGTAPSLQDLLRPLGGFWRRSLKGEGEEGEEEREEEEGEREMGFSGDEETDDLQKREDETLDGEKAGELEIATVQDMVAVAV